MAWKTRELKLMVRRLYFRCLPLSSQRTKYLIKHKVFAEVGKNFFWQPRKMPADGKLIKLHNNVAVAANVTFINHDVIYLVHRNIDKRLNLIHMGCIEIFDNVFIGANSTILSGVKIGPNAIIAAGSVVVKDVPEGSIVGGNPAKVIGSFDELMVKRLIEIIEHKELKVTGDRYDADRIAYEWSEFNKN